MARLGIIGGSGFYSFPEMENTRTESVSTPYGEVVVQLGSVGELSVAFIARHGEQHKTLPHKVNYRANIAALAAVGVGRIIALNAVGSISTEHAPDTFTVPDQIIDYTYGRAHTFADEESGLNQHVDFSFPFDAQLRLQLLEVLEEKGFAYTAQGVYACTQGPRLETAAEIRRLAKDGCEIVGMTMMPEAALAREKNIRYASICLCVNWAAGVSDEEISMDDIVARLNKFNTKLRELLHTFCFVC